MGTVSEDIALVEEWAESTRFSDDAGPPPPEVADAMARVREADTQGERTFQELQERGEIPEGAHYYGPSDEGVKYFTREEYESLTSFGKGFVEQAEARKSIAETEAQTAPTSTRVTTIEESQLAPTREVGWSPMIASNSDAYARRVSVLMTTRNLEQPQAELIAKTEFQVKGQKVETPDFFQSNKLATEHQRQLSPEERKQLTAEWKEFGLTVADMIVPGVYTASHWGQMTTKDRVVNVSADVASVALMLFGGKMVSAATRPLRGVTKAERLATVAGKAGKNLSSATMEMGALGTPAQIKAIDAAQRASMKADREFLDQLAKIKQVSPSELKAVERKSGLKGLAKSLQDVSNASDDVEKAWSRVEKTKFNPDATTPKEIKANRARVKALTKLDGKHTELQATLERADSTLKPRYREAPYPGWDEPILKAEKTIEKLRKEADYAHDVAKKRGIGESHQWDEYQAAKAELQQAEAKLAEMKEARLKYRLPPRPEPKPARTVFSRVRPQLDLSDEAFAASIERRLNLPAGKTFKQLRAGEEKLVALKGGPESPKAIRSGDIAPSFKRSLSKPISTVEEVSANKQMLADAERMLAKTKNPKTRAKLKEVITQAKRQIEVAEKSKVAPLVEKTAKPGTNLPATKTTTAVTVKRVPGRAAERESVFPGIKKSVAVRGTRGLFQSIPIEAFGRMTLAQIAKRYGTTENELVWAVAGMRPSERALESTKLTPSERERVIDAVKALPKPETTTTTTTQPTPIPGTGITTTFRPGTPPRLRTPPALRPPPKIVTPPTPPAPPTTTPPPATPPTPPISPPVSDLAPGKTRPWTKEDIASAIAWRQGFGWWAVRSPYQNNDWAFFMPKNLPDGIKTYPDRKTAFATVQRYKGPELREPIKKDMGIFDVLVRNPRRLPGAVGAIKFRRDRTAYPGSRPARPRRGMVSVLKNRVYHTNVRGRTLLSREPLGRVRRG